MEEANPMFSEAKLPESPRLPMEFLSRSWSLPALQLSKALSHSLPSLVSKTVASCTTTPPILEEDNAPPILTSEDQNLQTLKQRLISGGHSFSFASSTTSQLVLERIMSQSEVSPMTSGRPSCSEPITSLNDYQIDSPDISLSPPHEFDYNKFLYSSSTPQPLLPTPRVSGKNGGGSTPGGAGSKTVGRWLKDRREKKKEETRVQNAQLHASISVAAVAAAIAATTAATAAASSSSSKKDEQAAMTDMAMASAATLVAARCVEAAEAMGADQEHLASVISSAVNVQSHGDIMTLTAAAATALRGAATLKARTMKEVCNIAAVLPVEKGFGTKGDSGNYMNGSCNGEGGFVGEDILGLCNEQLLARGSELLKRTRQGDLHWKLVSVYINKEDEVVLKMKSLHMGGKLTKKKKKALLDVCKDTMPWPERYMMEGGEDRRYFGLKTVSHRVIEFECKNQKEYHLWTQGVSRLLSIATERRKNKF